MLNTLAKLTAVAVLAVGLAACDNKDDTKPAVPPPDTKPVSYTHLDVYKRQPIHWGYEGVAKKGFIANTLTPFVGDANTQTPEFKAFLVNVEKV